MQQQPQLLEIECSMYPTSKVHYQNPKPEASMKIIHRYLHVKSEQTGSQQPPWGNGGQIYIKVNCLETLERGTSRSDADDDVIGRYQNYSNENCTNEPF